MSWWHILCGILLLDICLPLWSCKLRYARKGMSKGETNVWVTNELQRLSPYQCWTLMDKLWAGPSTTLTSERTNVGGIASRWDRWSFRPFTSAPGSLTWGKIPVNTGNPSIIRFNDIYIIHILVTASVSDALLFASFCALSRERMSQRGSRNILQQSALIFHDSSSIIM